MRRVTLDTNEFVSALSGGRRALRLLHMAIDEEIEIAISESIIAETIRVLREKFDWPPNDLHGARLKLQNICRIVRLGNVGEARIVKAAEFLDIAAGSRRSK